MHRRCCVLLVPVCRYYSSVALRTTLLKTVWMVLFTSGMNTQTARSSFQAVTGVLFLVVIACYLWARAGHHFAAFISVNQRVLSQ